jgi:hypothetical protein
MAIGIYFLSAGAVRKAVNQDNVDDSQIKSRLNHTFFSVKRQFRRIFNHLGNYLELHLDIYEHKFINNSRVNFAFTEPSILGKNI